MNGTEEIEAKPGEDWPELMTTVMARAYIGGRDSPISKDTLYRYARRYRVDRLEGDGNLVRWERRELDRIKRGMTRQFR